VGLISLANAVVRIGVEMNRCNYRIGDAIVLILLVLLVSVLFGHKAITEHPAWGIGVGAIATSFAAGAWLNMKARARDKVRQIREARQLALGVPPDEAA
jgi:uncharacterized membrane protein